MKKILIPVFLVLVLQLTAPALFCQSYEDYLKGPKRLFTGQTFIEATAVGDVNGDGYNDVVAVSTFYYDPENDYKLFVFLQDSSSTPHGFFPPAKYNISNPIDVNPTVLIQDVNDDGLNDVIVDTDNGFGVYYQDGSGTLSDIQPFIPTHSKSWGPQAIAVGDFNNDGRYDVVIPSNSSGNYYLEVFLQDVNGDLPASTIYSSPIQPRHIAVGRLNTDNRDDIVISDNSTSAAVYCQNAGGTLDAAVVYDTGYRINWLDVGDVNNDGRDDLVVNYLFSEDQNIGILYQDGAGTLTTPPSYYGDLWDDWAVKVADVNRDGRNDIILQTGLMVLYQTAGGVMESDYTTYYALGSQHPHSFDFGDINGDGWGDVVMARGGNQNIGLNLGWDSGTYLSLAYPDGGEEYYIDSYVDIVYHNQGSITEVDIAYSIDGGGSWRIIEQNVESDGYNVYLWTTPLTPSDNCLIRVSSGGYEDTSYYAFSLLDDGVDRLNILSPSNGDNLVADTTFPISWEYSGTMTNVKIEYSSDNGSTWTTVAASQPINDTYQWTVPDTPSTECKIRISDAADDLPRDTMTGTFNILAPGSEVINVTSPNGGEVLTGGSSQTITWTSVGSFPNVHIEYSTNNGSSWTNIIAATPNDGSYSWTLPNVASSECLVRISDAADGNPTDQSNNVFSITPLGGTSLTVTAPNGGENLWIGTPNTITWTSTGSFASVHIEYSTDNGASWIDVVNSTSNDGSYTWTVPNTASTQCLMRISDAADGDPTDTSNGTFAISVAQPSITITSPQGGEYWLLGSAHDITWTTWNTVGDVKIQYSTDNQSTWHTIVASTPNDGSYPWTVPNTPSTTCFVKISEAADGFPYNISSAFSMVTELTGTGTSIGLSHTTMYFASMKSSTAKTPAQQLVVVNAGGIGTLRWQASDDASWLFLDNISGVQSGLINVSINPTNIPVGTHTGTITVTDPNAVNSPQTVTVYYTVYAAHGDSPPFGSFETPIDGSTVSSSIPVTGWALDDIGIDKVTIWRDKVQGEGSGIIYIGDAVQVEGARPDVEQIYPTYPMSYKAGWGYMMLTNFLPNGGNGTFTLHAYAEDVSGHEVKLGSKTITCNNAGAVKPFGAIDTPTQGGQANGSSFRNHGWVLTPMPNMIPTNGSTIKVYIDGVSLGNPTYNIYREDVATLFPGYANSSGAHAYMDIDTTVYSNGLHTIQWVATDNAGNSDGIGSRYFTVQNSGYATRSSTSARLLSELDTVPVNKTRPVTLILGYNADAIPAKITGGEILIDTNEDTRVELHLDQTPNGTYHGYMAAGKELKSLPVGSTLDQRKGVFCWQPGPGFTGKYRLIFIHTDPAGKVIQQPVTVSIAPKYGKNKKM